MKHQADAVEAVWEPEDWSRAQASALATRADDAGRTFFVYVTGMTATLPASITRSKQAWTQPYLQQTLVIGVDRGRVLDYENGVLLDLVDIVVGLGPLALDGLRVMTWDRQGFRGRTCSWSTNSTKARKQR